MKFRKREDFYKDRNKFVSFLFKWALRLSFPLRRPIAFLIVLLVLFLAPTFGGVKPQTVHIWYWEKIKIAYNYVAESVASIWNKATLDVDFLKSPFAEKGVDKLVQPSDNRAQKSKRQAFSQALKPSSVVNVQQSDDNDIVVPVFSDRVENVDFPDETQISPVMVENVRVPQMLPQEQQNLVEKPDGAYRKDVYGLTYLDKTQSLVGKMTVFDVNTLEIDGTSIILFGIYADPKSPDGAAGRAYLMKNFNEKNAVCQIVAYTEQKVATAICYVDNVNLNKQLVIKGYSRNVAL